MIIIGGGDPIYTAVFLGPMLSAEGCTVHFGPDVKFVKARKKLRRIEGRPSFIDAPFLAVQDSSIGDLVSQ